MYCMYCGHEIGEDAVFCPRCGERQNRPDEQRGAQQGTRQAPRGDETPASRAAGGAPVGRASATLRVDDGAPAPQPVPAPARTAAQRPVSAPVAAPGSTRVMPRPEKAAFVPAAVPGRGPSAAASPRAHAFPERRASSPEAAPAAKPRGAVVAVVVFTAFAVLAGGAFAFARLGSSSSGASGSSAAAQSQAQSQGASSATTSKTGSQADSGSAKKDDATQKEIELDGLTVSGESIVYVNPTFGYTATLPSSFKAVAASADGSSASFEDASSGIRVDVSAEANTSGATAASALDGYTAAYDVSYQASGSSWMVASWEDGAGDYYAKEYVGSNYVTRILYSTPTASHETGSQLIEDTVGDFKPGAL